MNEKADKIRKELYRFYDAQHLAKEVDSSRFKCMHYNLAKDIRALALMEMDQVLGSLVELISDYLIKLEPSERGWFSKFFNGEESFCTWKKDQTFGGIIELELKLYGFNKDTQEYYCLIEIFRSVGDNAFDHAGYDRCDDKFYIVYNW